MNTSHVTDQKKKYLSPEIICVELDNEISLALASSPPEGPGEGSNILQNNSLQDPYKSLSV